MRWFVAFGVLVLATALHADEGNPFVAALSAWFGSLDQEQQATASYRFYDQERFDLRLAPLGLEGLRRDAMSEEQWQAWLAVLDTGLSDAGLEKVRAVMSLEREVRERDGEGWSGALGGWFGGFIHGEEKYYVSLYGDVDGAPRPRGIRFDGHHLSLNWTDPGNGELSVTPFFLGSEPREVEPERERAGLRVLALEEDLGFALWNALTVGQRGTSELPFEFASGLAGANRNNFLGEGATVIPGEPQGIARGDLSPEQQERLDALIHVYLSNFEEDIVARHWAAIDAAGRDAIHFAWAGYLEPGHAGYYRIQGPTFLIEWDNTLEDADHVHTIIREWDGDFGRDLLAEHYATAHGLGSAPGAITHSRAKPSR